MSDAWKSLRQQQKKAKKNREIHKEVLADHCAARRNTTRVQEIEKISQAETTRSNSAKHK